MSECQMSDANIEELDELQQNTLAVPLFPYTLLSSNSYKEPYITIVRSIYGTEYGKRLFKKLDELYENGALYEPMFAQIGTSTYQPKYYEFKDFISPDEFTEKSDNTFKFSKGATLYASVKIIGLYPNFSKDL